MGLQNLQAHILQDIPDSTTVVDLLKLARERSRREGPLKIVIDGESCLSRLYGGYFPVWTLAVWDKMYLFLRNLATLVQNSNLELVVFFNGTLEHDRLDTEILKQYQETYRSLEDICKHVTHKRKPPPKVWWIPPSYLRSAIRISLRHLDVKVMQTVDDHHKDLVRYCLKNKVHGIAADDPEYLVWISECRYFSAQKMKLTFKGSLETVEVKLKKVFETFNFPKDRIFIFSSLLSNHILTEEDLKDFYADLGINTKDPQSKATVIEKVAEFIGGLETKDPEKIAATVAAKSLKTENASEEEKAKVQVLTAKIVKCLRYYSDSKAAKGPSSSNKTKSKKSKKDKQPPKPTAAKASSPKASTTTEAAEDKKSENAASSPASSASNDDSKVAKLAYRVNPAVEEITVNRTTGGAMSPYVSQILKHKEIKLPLLIEDVRTPSTELPRAHEVFRPLRQFVYAVLFNLHHLKFLAKKRSEKVPTIQVKETYFCTTSKTLKTDTVKAVQIGWGVPTVEKLFFGEGDDAKNKRIRAFLTILKSETQMILDSRVVPQQLIILACVLRYIIQSDKKVLRHNEFEAFIAQAFIQDATDPSLAQDIEVTNLTMRCVHLAHLFNEGIEMALLANDSCGAPVPHSLFCPWLFFNGKIFNYVLEQQAKGKSLNEILGYKRDLLLSIEQFSIAICDGIKPVFAPEPNLSKLFPGKGGLINSLLPAYTQDSRIPYSLQQSQQAALYGASNAMLSQLAGPTLIPRGGRGGNSASYNPAYGLAANASLRNLGQGLIGPGGSRTGAYSGYLAGESSSSGYPGKQRVQNSRNRGGQLVSPSASLEVAGQIVANWAGGPFIGPQRVVRNNVFAANNNAHLASLMGLRISNKVVPTNRGRVVTTPHWSKKTNKNQKKSIMKKSNESNTKAGSNKTNAAAANGSSSSSPDSNKTKGVSFQEESKTNNVTDNENGATSNDTKSLVSSSQENDTAHENFNGQAVETGC